jgi:hypothetical protein
MLQKITAIAALIFISISIIFAIACGLNGSITLFILSGISFLVSIVLGFLLVVIVIVETWK